MTAIEYLTKIDEWSSITMNNIEYLINLNGTEAEIKAEIKIYHTKRAKLQERCKKALKKEIEIREKVLADMKNHTRKEDRT